MLPRLPADIAALVLSYVDDATWGEVAVTCKAGRAGVMSAAGLLVAEMAAAAAAAGGTVNARDRSARFAACQERYRGVNATIIEDIRQRCTKTEHVYARNMESSDPHAGLVRAVACMHFARALKFADAQNRLFSIDYPRILETSGSILMRAMHMPRVGHYFRMSAPLPDSGDRPLVVGLKQLHAAAIDLYQDTAAVDGGVDYKRYLRLKRALAAIAAAGTQGDA